MTMCYWFKPDLTESYPPPDTQVLWSTASDPGRVGLRYCFPCAFEGEETEARKGYITCHESPSR